MQKFAVLVSLLLLVILPACGRQIPATPEATSTPDPDPCSPQNMPAAVRGINDLMREFDDVTAQLTSAAAEQLPTIISDLQRIRRAAEDLPVPPCLVTLKRYQLNHMNLVIQSLLGFVGGQDQETLRTGFEIARAEYEKYSLELVRLLGITLATVTVTP